jgi:uncharacterized protein YoxC
MDKVSGGMKSLCEDIIAGHENRKSGIKQLKGQVEVLRDNARKFLADSKRLHEEMSKDLKKRLQEDREDLIKNVNVMRENFKKKEREIRADLDEASKLWNKMDETLKSKKIKPL